MKLTYAQLEPHLAKHLSAVYLISGDELLLKQDAINLIRKAAKQAGFSERIRLTPEAGFDWEQLYTLLYSTSLMAEKRIIELDFRDITPNKTASTILQSYADHLVSDNLLLIDLSKVDDKIAKSAWYKALEKIGVSIPIWPIPREQMPQWIIQRAKKYKMQMSPDAAALLTDYVEGNLVAAAQAVEKIYLLKPEIPIDAALIESILADESRFTVFDFIENLIAGDKARALHILQALKEEGSEPILILWGITRELRMLSEMSQQLKSGLHFEALFQKHRIFAKRQTAVRKFLTRFSTNDCWQYLSHAMEIDQIIKGASPGDVWDSLQLFCLRFAV